MAERAKAPVPVKPDITVRLQPLPRQEAGDPGEELAGQLQAMIDNMQRTLNEAKKEASDGIVRQAAMLLPGAIDRLVLQRYRRMVAVAFAAQVGLMAAAGAVGYWIGHGGFG